MHFKTITSASNPAVKEMLWEKQHRQSDRFFIEGHHLIEMAVAAGAEMVKVFFTEEYRAKHGDLIGRISKKGAELTETAGHILLKLSDTETPQGIIALVHYKPLQLDKVKLKTKPLLVVCDGIQDPGNLGTIIRTSDAAGADAVIILPGTCDAFMPKAIRATAGSVFNIPVVHSETSRLIEWLRDKRLSLFVTDAKASKTIYEADLNRPLALVFGSEAHGTGEKLKDAAGMLLNIPIPGKAESLNVAISAAVCLYEAFRQRTALS